MQGEVVIVARLENPRVNGDPRIVDPGIDAAKPLDCRLRQALEISAITNVSRYGDGFASFGPDVLRDVVGRFFAAGRDHQLGTTLSCKECRGEADPARCSCDDYDLLVQRLQCL